MPERSELLLIAEEMLANAEEAFEVMTQEHPIGTFKELIDRAAVYQELCRASGDQLGFLAWIILKSRLFVAWSEQLEK